MKNVNRNVRFDVRNHGNQFDIYLDFSGQKEYLLTHKRNWALFNLLKNGQRLDAVKRWKVQDSHLNSAYRDKLERSIKYLLSVVDKHLKEKTAYQPALHQLTPNTSTIDTQRAA